MTQSYLTSYQPIGENEEMQEREEEDPDNYPNMLVHVVPKSDKTQWNHIEDLDSFFTRIYQYHQQDGFLCMVVKQIFDIINFLFIILFTTFLLTCIDYDILFKNKLPENLRENNKITISDCINSWDVIWENLSLTIIFLLICALSFWAVRIFLVVVNYFQYSDIKKFYNVALGIKDKDLENVTWNEVQQRLMEVQVEQRMCIHKETLTELDIYHRILRFNNYFIAMINKEVIPLKYNLPFLGQYTYLTRGLRFNIDMILFSGIGAPFKNNWHLKDEYKRFDKRLQLADALSKRILYVGILNFILCPFIFIFQILRSFFHHAAILKKEPGFLGLRKWSHQGQVVLRHYNELDHEFRARLNRAYRSSTQYMSIFTSSLSAIIASHVTFICGSIVAVLGSLTVYDEDVIQVEYVIGLLTGSCFVIYACSSFIEKENLVWCPEVLMTKILSEVHYLPDAWKDKAHTTYVRNEFSELFQYKFVHLIESLLSPLITPFIFCFCMRYRALDIVDFLRNFTVEVIGVGDICSFAQMSLRKHGNRTWHPENFVLNDSLEVHDDATYSTDNGKTELSLLHFALTNPSWKPPQESEDYLHAFRVQARKDRTALPILNEENALSNSLNSVFGGNNPMQSRWLQTSRAFSQNACINVSHLEGSNQEPSSGIFGSLSHDMYFDNQMPKKASDPVTSFLPPMQPQDMVALDMSISTLYLRELHQRQRCAANYTDTPINMPGNYFSDVGWARSHDVRSNESYYHSTDPPLAEGSYHPSQLNPIPDASDSVEGNSSQIFKENTPLLNPRT